MTNKKNKQLQQQTQIPCGNDKNADSCGMTNKKNKQLQQQTQIPCGNDKQEGSG
jgi:hypothetical protein